MADPVISPYTFADLKTPKDVVTNETALYQALIDNGFTQALSWEDGSTPSALIEIDADALTNFQLATQATLFSGFNDWASGDALTEHSRQIYQNDRRDGTQAIIRLQLTDTGNGPFIFDPTTTAFSQGQGGLLYNGISDPTQSTPQQVTVPLNGSAYVYVEASDVGMKFNAAIGSINTFAKGSLPGVVVTNPSDGQTAAGTVVGSDAEQDPSLQARNRTQWSTLGVGSPPPAYENWARAADVSITRVEVFPNLDLLDPGVVSVIIAGASGGLPPQTVLAAQNNIAPNLVGGTKIPETAKCIVSSAQNNSIPIIANLYIAGAYNTPAFQAQILANILAFQAALRIGAKISWVRVQEVTTEIAGLDPEQILIDADWLSPLQDLVQAYYQVAVFDTTQLNFISAG